MPTFTVEADLPIAAPRIWKALRDSSDLLPKIAPQAFASIEHVEGPADDVGAVRLVKLGSAAPEGAYVKEKLTALDHSSFTLSTVEVEAGHLARGFSKWEQSSKFTPVDDSSSKWESTITYEGDNEAVIAQTKEGLKKLFLGLAEYINKSGAYA